MNKLLTLKTNKIRAFSLVELLGIVALVAILAGVGYATISGLRSNIQAQKLDSEVATLNSALSSYLAFGGNLKDADTAEKAIAKLRTIASSDIAHRIPGASSSMVDPRIAIRYQSEAEAATNQKRATWNYAKKKFEITSSGSGAIGSFYLDSELAEAEKIDENREFTELYAKDDTWVWDFSDTTTPGPAGPTIVSTGIPSATTPPVSPPPIPPVDPAKKLLAAPIYSVAGGDYSIREFDLLLTLSNPNPAGSSTIYYQIDFAGWNQYSPGTVLSVQPDQTIASQSIANSSEWTDSSRAAEAYKALSVQLKQPVITTSAPSFGAFEDRLISITLENPNTDEPGKLQYRLNNDSWFDYEGFLLLDRIDFENGAIIEGRVVSTTPYFEDSSVAVDLVSADPLWLDGLTHGEFYNPFGDAGMVSNLNSDGASSEYFEWGRVSDENGNAYEGLSKSWMEFSGTNTGSMDFGQQFKVGDLEYYNGSTLVGSIATGVNLNLNLLFNVAGKPLTSNFDFAFDIETTTNTDDAFASADFIKINRNESSTIFEFEGLTLELVLQFGETTTQGFSSFDSFHVFENQMASSAVYASIFDRTESKGNVSPKGEKKGKGNGKGNE